METATVIAKTITKRAIRFFTEACDGVGFMHAATKMADIAGAKAAVKPMPLPFAIVAPASHIVHEIAKAKTKNQIVGCCLIIEETLLFDSIISATFDGTELACLIKILE